MSSNAARAAACCSSSRRRRAPARRRWSSGWCRCVPNLRMSRSYTSRPARAGEQDGVDYNFISRERFEAMVARRGVPRVGRRVRQLLRHRRPPTPRPCWRAGEDVVLVIDVQGARQVRSRGIETVGIFVLPPSAAVLEQRLRGRSKDSEEQIRRRLEVALPRGRRVRRSTSTWSSTTSSRRRSSAHPGDRPGRAGAGEDDARRGRKDHRVIQGTATSWKEHRKRTGSSSSSWQACARGSCWPARCRARTATRRSPSRSAKSCGGRSRRSRTSRVNPIPNPTPKELANSGDRELGVAMSLIALGVTGGIGAYKAVEVCRGLQKRGHDVVAVMTRSAARFVGPVTFEAITRRPVITSQWKPGMNADIEHIAIADRIDAAAGGAVHGQRDRQVRQRHRRRLPELAVSGHQAPVLLAPAMNTNMLAHDGGAAEPADAGGARRAVRRAGRGLSGVRLDRQGPAGRAGRDRRGRGRAC